MATVIEKLPGVSGRVVDRLAGSVVVLATLAAFAKTSLPSGMRGILVCDADLRGGAAVGSVWLSEIRSRGFLGNIFCSLYPAIFSLMRCAQRLARKIDWI
ncbi:MAG: hypothetical protein QM581_00550 [Pseudomonas sp.]